MLVLIALVLSSPADSAVPVEFRCDSMQMFSKPNRVICQDNVVVRRGDLTLCCDAFEGFADDDGQWQRMVCSDHVRARRADETMWSDRATYLLQQGDLILTGKPLYRQGPNLLKGQRIVVDTKRDRAHIEQPEGVVATKPLPKPTALLTTGKLPSRCPVIAPPKAR